ncbi:MAG: hypothetical protein HeimC3_38740 [Candidatus Heimdallarchaeota archaeon LC_3]|nr:MAG: hypothetical protein HeimC3_38740 [Candidatus Heimdallarchaeota archaeon LC_3]
MKMSLSKSSKISCICTKEIDSSMNYKLVILKGITEEIDIFCQNESCSIRELGYIKFRRNVDNSVSFLKAKFYPTFVSFNINSSNDPKYSILKKHLVEIVQNRVDWIKISKFLMS